MTEKGGQHILQTALSSGFSATEGVHNKKTQRVDSSFDGLAHTLPQDVVPQVTSRVTFKGKHHNVDFPYISWGAWSWGDKASWSWSDDEMPALEAGWKHAVSEGAGWIDNAQAYGSGRSEEITKGLLQGLPRDSYQIQTKWYVVPDNLTNVFHPNQAPAIMLRDSLKRMGLGYIDCYLVHGNIFPSSIKAVAKGLADAVEEGLTKTVGVANFNEADMIKMADALAEYGVPLATNQCEYNLLRRHPETSGLLAACKERGIHFQSYSSLAQGRLTGKYDKNNPPPKNHRFSSYPMEELEPQLNVLREIADRRGKPVAAVALNYNISKGILPVVGIRSKEMVDTNLAALGWRLSEEEMKQLDAVGLEGKTTKLWQQG
ncbi:aryl-alcohol dehydrogenase-like protein [Elsinoe australis]|uniref:Aryl-alcohol dehydrogenase-like protein n=1 Tax=Elsinoe australis TaxID=40998 RepID=A0A4U7B2R8_9PEZI|nr:aryl-alcohol dehydrogenase-like protein [Elsinoe australis]